MASLTTIDNSTNTLLKWYFPSIAALNAAYPVGWNGWVAFVGKDQYGWQVVEKRWFSATSMTVDWGLISWTITNQSDLIAYIAAQITFSNVANETPVGVIDSVNTTFTTLANFTTGTIKVFLNWIRQRVWLSNDYIENTNNQIIFNFPPIPGDVLIVDYLRIL